MTMILPRQSRDVRCRYSSSYGYYDCSTRWSSWGRWVFLAGIIGFFLIFFILACVSARRRRRAGRQPFRGTGWMGGPPPGHGPAVYTAPRPTDPSPPYQAPSSPAPQYYPPANPGYNNNNPGGYYGPQGGVELQPPTNIYQPQRAAEPEYAPPPGPPPNQNKA
ncbi:MAG: hypothetical protein M1815_000858 [Lichina confinis]|nr:MAG: hypothetical protein M1815_000858 [Lichina confinis]